MESEQSKLQDVLDKVVGVHSPMSISNLIDADDKIYMGKCRPICHGIINY